MAASRTLATQTTARSGAVLAAAAGAFGSLDTAVNIAFPDMIDDFSLDVGDLQWVVVFYILVYGGSLLAAGQLADNWGYARVLRIGAVLSTIAMALCAAAPTFAFLLGARAIQGVGAAMVMAAAPALLTSTAAGGPDADSGNNRAVGVFQTAAAIGLAVGPVVGGPLVEWRGWPAVYWFRVPLGLLLVALALRTSRSAAPRRAEVDRVGTALISLSLGAAVLALNLSGTRGWTDAVVIAAGASAAGTAVCFVVVSRRVTHPIIDLKLFRSLEFASANALAVVANGAMFATWLLVPSLLVDRLGVSVFVSGLVLAASPAATALAAAAAARVTAPSGTRAFTTIGLTIEGLGMLGMSQVDAGWSAMHVGLLMAVVGTGLGLFAVPNMATVMRGLGRDRQGVGGGLSLMNRTVGVVAGVAIASAITDRLEPDRGFLGAFEVVFAASGVALTIAAVVAVFVIVRERSRSDFTRVPSAH